MPPLALILRAALLPRVQFPLFHFVAGHWRVNSIEFSMRLMAAQPH